MTKTANVSYSRDFLPINREFAIIMDRFRTRKQCAKEAEVEEVHVEENLETPRTKHNNVLVVKFNEKWKDGRPCLSAEDGKMFCSYCKDFDKISRNKLTSGCESMRILLSISLLLMIVQPQLSFKK